MAGSRVCGDPDISKTKSDITFSFGLAQEPLRPNAQRNRVNNLNLLKNCFLPGLPVL
jgi:hypothetical protein